MADPLHILKLCVGCDSIADLESWIDENRAHARRLSRPYEQVHTTRMTPKRTAEILGGGSLFWVIRGFVSARQTILDLRPITGGDGISRCEIVIEPLVRPVLSRPCRPFQGWRYLPHGDAPDDLAPGATNARLPDELRRELMTLGLL